MRKFFGSTGSVSRLTVESRALESNMLGDRSARVVDVYVPAGHDGQGLLLLVDLAPEMLEEAHVSALPHGLAHASTGASADVD